MNSMRGLLGWETLEVEPAGPSEGNLNILLDDDDDDDTPTIISPTRNIPLSMPNYDSNPKIQEAYRVIQERDNIVKSIKLNPALPKNNPVDIVEPTIPENHLIIRARVKALHNAEHKFKIFKTDPLQKIIKAIAAIYTTNEFNVSLKFYGMPVLPTETAQDHEMENDDIIDIVVKDDDSDVIVTKTTKGDQSSSQRKDLEILEVENRIKLKVRTGTDEHKFFFSEEE